MTNKRNPFRIIEKIGKAVLVTLVTLVILFTLFCLTMMFLASGFGWWTFLAVPGTIVLFVAVLVLLTLLEVFVERVGIWWRAEKQRWDHENRKGKK